MKRFGKTTLLIGLVAAAGAWVASSEPGEDEAAATSRHLVNQLWVERWPDGHRDIFGKLMVLRTEHGRVGVVGRSSTWRHFFEAFLWAKEGDELIAAFPQEGHRARFRVRTWRCAGEAPPPFELCLKVERGTRTAVFYSKDDWEIRPEHRREDLAAIAEANPWLGVGEQDMPAEIPVIDVEALPHAEPNWAPF